MTDQLATLIRETAQRHRLPHELVAAICQVESTMGLELYRYEPDYRWLVQLPQMTPTEIAQQKSSWGIMQIMGAAARERGYTRKLMVDLACDHALGLEYGCRQFVYFLNRYHTYEDTIAAYNAGHVRKVDGEYHNQPYVDKVLRWWNQFKVKEPEE